MLKKKRKRTLRRKKKHEVVEAPGIRKSKWIANGKAKVIYSKNSKKKTYLPQLDEVPRKRRKLLDASTVAAVKANVCSCCSFLLILG